MTRSRLPAGARPRRAPPRRPAGLLRPGLAPLTALLATLALACGGGDAGIDPLTGRAPGGGVALPAPLPRPAFVLPDTRGAPFDFRARTAGRPTFLLFGYTHCPDVCPVQVANLTAALHRLAPSDRGDAAVVFVTVDPRRDSASTLRAWLDAFDRAFVGLRGGEATIDSIQRALGLPPAVRGPARPDGSYDVGHAAPVLVFTADDTARVQYGFGTRQADWARALPGLLAPAGGALARLRATLGR